MSRSWSQSQFEVALKDPTQEEFHALRTPQLTLPHAVATVPIVALVIGLAGATGGYALLDDDDVTVQPAQVGVAESPIQPGEGGTVKNEASIAAAVGGAVAGPSTAIKDEAATAAAIGNSASSSSGETKNEAAIAVAIGNSSSSSSGEIKDEAATAAAIGNSASTPRARPRTRRPPPRPSPPREGAEDRPLTAIGTR